MENKLQQLTEKLYNEGLSKGKQEGDAVLDRANAQAKQIIEQANEQSRRIIEKAKQDAEQLSNTTKSEIQLAANQMVSAIRQQILAVITASVFEAQIKDAYKNGDYVKELIVKAIGTFNAKDSEGVKVIVPEGFEDVVRNAVAEKLNQGIEIVTNSKIKAPFRIAPADGSYVVSFSDEDFDALFKSYIRPMVSDLLYK